jgi:hypothetical protein
MSKKSTENPPIYVIRRGDVLQPEMQADAEMIRKMKPGERIRVDLRTGRSPARLRFYWQLLNRLRDATDCAPNSEALHEAIKLDLGHATPIRLRNGMTVLVPSSIAFDKMTEESFAEYLERAIRWIGENYHVTPEELMNGKHAA